MLRALSFNMNFPFNLTVDSRKKVSSTAKIVALARFKYFQDYRYLQWTFFWTQTRQMTQGSPDYDQTLCPFVCNVRYLHLYPNNASHLGNLGLGMCTNYLLLLWSSKVLVYGRPFSLWTPDLSFCAKEMKINGSEGIMTRTWSRKRLRRAWQHE